MSVFLFWEARLAVYALHEHPHNRVMPGYNVKIYSSNSFLVLCIFTMFTGCNGLILFTNGSVIPIIGEEMLKCKGINLQNKGENVI